MKYIFSFFLSVILVLSSFTTAFASENITFTLQSAQCKINRLFTIEMVAKSDKPLCAATFEFIYDSKMFEYRKIKVSDDESKISANEKNGCVTAVYLNTYGKDISDNTVIFSITFKAIKDGVGYIDFNVKECVDSNVEWFSIGNCTSAEINVESTKDSLSNSIKTENSKTDKSEPSTGKSNRKKSTEPTTTPATIDEYGSLNDAESSNKMYLLIGFMFGCGLLIIILIIYGIFKKYCNKNNNKSSA